jgi:predicted dehydrogenase
MRMLQVGVGGWGSSWAAEMRKHPELVTPVGYVDLDPAALARLGVEDGLCFTSLGEALDATSPDVVLVTTSLPHHASVAIEALSAGVDVIVEKPLAPTLDDARRMIAAADASGRVLMVSQNYRHYPAARTVADLVARRALGEVGSVTVAFRKDAVAGPADSLHHQLVEPLLLDMSIHHFDLMRFVLGGSASTVRARSWNPAWSTFRDPAEAVVEATFGDVVVDYRGSWVSRGAPTLWAGEWTISCEQGDIVWTGRGDTTVSLDRVSIVRGDAVEHLELPAVPLYDRLGTVAEFARSRAEGRRPSTDARDNIDTLALTLGAIESAAMGESVTLGQGVAA